MARTDDSIAMQAVGALESLELLSTRRCRVVLMGLPNSGRSTIANAIVGDRLLANSVLAGSGSFAVQLGYSKELSLHVCGRDGRKPVDPDGAEAPLIETGEWLDVGLPASALADFDLLDTGGFDGSADAMVPRLTSLDLPVWCTAAVQAWTGEERQIWSSLPRRLRARGILAVTFTDLIPGDGEQDLVARRLQEEAGSLFRSIVFVGRNVQADADDEVDVVPLTNEIERILGEWRQRHVRRGTSLLERILRGASH